MKKKLVIIIPIIIAILTLVLVYIYYSKNDREVSFSISEREWIEKNSGEKINISVPSDIPVFTLSGNGVISKFLNDFEDETTLSLNKISYNLSDGDESDNIKVRLLSNETSLSDNDILVYTDGYVVLSLSQGVYGSLGSLKDKKVGALTSDVAELTYYLGNTKVASLDGFESYDKLFSLLDNKELDSIIVPHILTLNKTIKGSYSINYYINEMNKKIVISLNDKDNTLNSIIKKYYNNWSNKYYVTEYNKSLLNYYLVENSINDKAKAELIGKNYVYGYVNNIPYDVNYDGEMVGIASSYINRMARLTGITFEFVKYDNASELLSSVDAGNVDIYFNYYSHGSAFYQNTVSVFPEDYVVLGTPKNNTPITTLEGLKGLNVNIIKDNAIFTYFKNNSRAVLNECDSISSLKKGNNLIVIDKEIYDFYKNTDFRGYVVYYEGSITDNYVFSIKNEDTTFYNLFNYLITTNSYSNYKNSALNDLTTSVLDKSSFQQLYLIVLGIILLPLLIIFAIYTYLKNKKHIIRVKKEDRRKYTDNMTNLKNRAYLNLNIDSWNNSNVYPQAIVIVDLNNVKYVNDNHGHEAGDDLIIKAAGVLINTQLENSELIRTDGNEFLIYLVGYSKSQVSTYVEKLNNEMKTLPYGFGASTGYSMIVDDIKTIDDAINEATLDMRTNKEANR